MSDFQNNAAKISIASLDGGPTVEAMYNPKELQVDRSVPWQKKNQANQGNTSENGIHLEFTGAEGRSVTVELLFDGWEDNTSISSWVADLETLASVIDASSTSENKRRPHRCVVTWGTTIQNFRCVIESLSTKYTMFAEDGTPMRATCTVKLKEADVVSMAQQKGGG